MIDLQNHASFKNGITMINLLCGEGALIIEVRELLVFFFCDLGPKH